MYDFKTDFVFKLVFGQHNEKSRFALISLTSCFLEKDISSLLVISNEPRSENLNQKDVRMDIMAKINNGEVIDLEMQNHLKKFDLDRFEYYTSLLLNVQEVKDLKYSELKDVFLLLFVNNKIFDDTQIIHHCKLSKDSFIFNRLLNVITVELPKLQKKKIEELNEQEAWIYLFKHGHKKNYQKKLETLSKRFKGVKTAMELNDNISPSGYEFFLQRSRELFDYEYISQNLKKEVEENVKKVAELKLEVHSKTKELKSTSKKLKVKNKKLKSATQKLESTSQKLESTSQKLESTSQKLESTSEELQTKSQELESAKQEIQELKNQLEQLKKLSSQ